MKEPDDSPTNAVNIPTKVESEKIPTDDAQSNKSNSKKEQVEEKKGGMSDYFVSRQNRRNTLEIS